MQADCLLIRPGHAACASCISEEPASGSTAPAGLSRPWRELLRQWCICMPGIAAWTYPAEGQARPPLLLHCPGCPGFAEALTALPAAFPQGTCQTDHCPLNHGSWMDVLCYLSHAMVAIPCRVGSTLPIERCSCESMYFLLQGKHSSTGCCTLCELSGTCWADTQ